MSRLHHRLGGAWLVVVLVLGLFGSPAKAEEVSLRLVPASEPNLTFHRFINRYDYERLCDRPCSIDVERTSLRLGAGLGSRDPVAGNLLQLEGDGRIEVSYRDRRPQRVAGLVVGAVGAVAALTLLGSSLGLAMADDIFGPEPGDNRAAEYGFASLGVALSFGAVATYLVLRKDVVESVYIPETPQGRELWSWAGPPPYSSERDHWKRGLAPDDIVVDDVGIGPACREALARGVCCC